MKVSSALTQGMRALVLTVSLADASSIRGAQPSVSQAEISKAPNRNTQTQDAFSNAVAGLEKRTGLVPVYLDALGSRVLIALGAANSEGTLGHYLYQAYLRTGLGSTPIGLDRSGAVDTQIIAFRRAGRRVYAELENTGFRADQGETAEKQAVRESFPASTIWSTDLIAERSDGSILIDISSFLTRDAAGVTDTLKDKKQGTFKMEPALSYPEVSATLDCPENVELEARETFVTDTEPDDELKQIYPRGEVDPSPAPHSLTLVIHHSLIKLPEPGYRIRHADPRVGGLDQTVLIDYSAPLDRPVAYRLAHRFRLEKREPNAARSPVKKPIVFYLDRAAPEPVRAALLEGARWWAQAFDAAGFIDAFQVEVLPEGISPLDARYNVINWVHRQTRGYSYGTSIIDPRTGEIVKGAVLLGSLRVRQDRMIYEGLMGAQKTGTAVQDDPLRVALARLRQLSAHETGHALGFEHNFAASTFDDRGSVMDYPPPRIKIIDGRLDFTDAYKVGIGSWDRFAVDWLYHEAAAGEDEESVLNSSVATAYAKGLRFVVDADARPISASHPYGSVWDDGSDAVAELAHTLEVRRIALEHFGADNVRNGTPLSELRRVIVPIYLFHRYEVDAVTKLVGGVNFTYAVKGDGLIPSSIVSPDDQRRALDALLTTLNPHLMDLSDATLTLLSAGQSSAPDKQYDIEVFGALTKEPQDLDALDKSVRMPPFKLFAAAAAAADITVGDLFDAARVNRVTAQGELDSKQLSLPELLSTTVNRVFFAAQPNNGEHISGLRRCIQERFMVRVAKLMQDKALSVVASAEIRAALGDLATRLGALKKGSREDLALGHYFAELITHDKLKDLADRDKGAQPVPPVGPPIGAVGEDASWRLSQ